MARVLSDDTKRKDAERIKNTYATVSCCIPKPLAEKFRVYCLSQGESMRGNLKRYIENCLSQTEKKTQQ